MVSILAFAAGLFAWFLADLPPISTVETRLVRPTTRILDRNGRLLYEVIDPDAGKQIDLSLNDLPEACIQATLATEDSRFYLHPGVDPIAIGRALFQNVSADGQIVSGASTLTQQLARTLLMAPEERYEQSIQRKLREAWLALRLELRYTKDELLALYLNQTYYGNWAYGIEAASQVFYAKPAAQLSRAECAVLAGLIQYPLGYSPLQHPEVAKGRQLTVLRLMREAGYITGGEENSLGREPLRFRSSLFDIEAPHFVMYVQAQMADRFGVDMVRQGGLEVTTTLDLDLQQEAESIVRRRLDQLNCRTPGICDETTDPNRRVDNAAAVVLDSRTGEILAMVGSPDYFDGSIQGNVNAALTLRQPGSAIKPLTYAAALDPAWSAQAGVEPLTPASIIADLPATFHVTDEAGGNVPYTPQNYDRSFHGPVSVRTALANSYNIPAVKVLERIGVQTLQEIASAAGISSFTNEYGLALTLGGGEVKLLELAGAFGILDDGVRLETRAIAKIEDQRSMADDGVLLTRSSFFDLQSSPQQVVSPTAAFLVTDILADPVARIPAFGEHSVLSLPFDAAVKTGTTTDWRDNWTVGYSSERIVGVWVGNADNTPMLDVSGIDGAGPIWRDLMLAAHHQEPPPFDIPEGIVEVTICTPSGMLPTLHCPRTGAERFIVGTQPTEPDNQFRPVTSDPGSSAQGERRERVYWHLPAEYRQWMVGQGIALPPADGGAGQGKSEERRAIEQTFGSAVDGENDTLALDDALLILSSPVSNSAFQIHPGVPKDRQQLNVAGYAAGDMEWTSLKLVKDGQVLAVETDVDHVEAWWLLEPGTHHFWLEGEPAVKHDAESDRYRSETALIVVEEFSDSQVLAIP
jgi:penicillin-binding protein 1C